MSIKVLKRYVPFSELEDKYLEDALTQISKKTYKKGEMLFKRGRHAMERHYLLSGKVDLINARYESTSLEAGQPVSFQALNQESPTSCSCIAKTDVKVFSIRTDALDRIMSWSESAAFTLEPGEMLTGEIEVSSIADQAATDWMSSLLQSPLFTRIPLTQVQELFARFEDCEVDAGELIVKEGEKGDFFYVLASGKVHVTNRSESVDVVLEPGSYFGEEALLGDTPRNATIKMLDRGRVKRLGSEDFEALLKAPVLQYIAKDEITRLEKPHKFIDVKMPLEYRINHFPGSINLPLARLRSAMNELAKASAYIVPDDAGSRADIAAHLLCQAGFDAYILRSAEVSESA